MKTLKKYFSLTQFILNNETLQFMFSYKYSTYQIFMDTCNEKQSQHNV